MFRWVSFLKSPTRKILIAALIFKTDALCRTEYIVVTVKLHDIGVTGDAPETSGFRITVSPGNRVFITQALKRFMGHAMSKTIVAQET